jgi:phage gp36-like protein
MLREAFELIDDGEPAAAVRALQRIVNRASPARLEQLSAQSLAAREQPLDELIARTRLKEALHGRHGRLFQMKVVTRYESAALGRLLERRQKELLEKRYAGRTIAQWAADRDAYERLRPDAPRMTNDARLAAAVIGARLRWEPRLTKDRAARRDLAVFRVELTRFIAHVINIPGYTSLGVVDDPNDPAAREARRLATSRPASQPTTSTSSAGKEKKP